MMDELDPRIDAALESYPLAPLPPGFVRRTIDTLMNQSMSQIAPAQVRFQLEFTDIAIPSFLALFLLAIAGITLFTLNFLDPLWLPRLQVRLDWLLFYATTSLPLPKLTIAATVAGSGLLLAILSLVVWLDRPSILLFRPR